jgi:sterol 3beta-glucosyltransferase
MIHPSAPHIQRAILEGLRQAGRRLVVLTGWNGWAACEPGPDRLFLPAAPHDWLFPRCAAIIHHCGSGTTAAALRSGRPSIALPLAADQFFWARRIHASGAGPAPLDVSHLTAAGVAGAVRQALNDPSIHRNAAALGAAVRSEMGLEKALAVIEQIAEPPAPSASSPRPA